MQEAKRERLLSQRRRKKPGFNKRQNTSPAKKDKNIHISI